MPAPHHLRHPAPHHAFTLTIPPAPPPQLLSILHPIATLHRLTILDLYIRTSPRPTSYLLPSILHLYICTSHPPPAAHCDPILSSPLLPFRTASHPSSARTHPILSTSQLSFYTPSHPSSAHPSIPLLRKSLHSPPKASSNPPVEIFYLKRRRRLILNILPRRHRVDNSVSSSVHSEEKA